MHRFILKFSVVIALFGALPAYAHQCKELLGAEWEWGALHEDRSIDETADGQIPRQLQLLEQSNFRKLYGFFGRTDAGHWVRNFIPNRVVQRDEFSKLVRKLKLQVVAEENGVMLRGIESRNTNEFHELMAGLLEARGKYNEDIKIRKIAKKWALFPPAERELDDLIPVELAEEWSTDSAGNDRFVCVEFPSERPFASLEGLANYLKHLVRRLDLKHPRKTDVDALEWLAGHVHYTLDIANMPNSEPRTRLYHSLIHFWGDRNDQALFSDLNVLKHDFEDYEPELLFDREHYNSIGQQLESLFTNSSFSILTRETYERVLVTDRGILVKDRDHDLDTFFDTNIPTIFKRLSFGLRASYGQTTFPSDHPIPLVGVESRAALSFSRAVRSLPQGMAQLESHFYPGSRGVISNLEVLRQKALELGLSDVGVLDDAESNFQAMPDLKWSMNQVRGLVFLPLTPWLDHPLVQQKWNSMDRQSQIKAVQRYRTALERYIYRINELAYARKNPRYQYRPWLGYQREALGGMNIVDRTQRYPDLEQMHGGRFRYAEIADDWFRKILLTEVVRFVSESRLSSLMGEPEFPERRKRAETVPGSVHAKSR